MSTIPQLIRRWHMINHNQKNYGTYQMQDLVRDIKKTLGVK